MTQKYIIRKIKRFSGLGAFFFLLYQHDPETDTYRLAGRYTSLGQLLSAIGCTEIENWQFLRQQKSPGGHVTVTCYSYLKTLGSCDVEIEVDVIEKSETGWTCDEADNRINCKLNPAELHKILFLLHGRRVEIQNELGNPAESFDVGNVISFIDEVAFIDQLSAKLNQKMRQYLKNHPDDLRTLLN